MNTTVKPTEMSDAELVSCIADNRDRDALAVLYQRYSSSLAGFIARKLPDQRLVDDVYNEVMFTVWEKAPSFRGDSKISTWIFGIAYRICLNQMRKEAKHMKNMDEQELDELPMKSVSSDEKNDQLAALKTAMLNLSEEHRQVTELAYYMGNSVAEIAAIMQCPVNTVKTRLYHARLQLKKYVTLNESASESLG